MELAHGAAQLYQNPMNGTLLSEGPVEPIVPLRGLAELGYTITWSRAGCAVKHPKKSNAGSGLDVQWSEGITPWLLSPRSSAWTRKRGTTDVSRGKKRIKSPPKSPDLKRSLLPADEPAGGEPGVCSKVSTFCISKVSGQDDQGSGEAPAKEDGSPKSGEFTVRKISLEHQQNWDAKFPSVDPKQDQQMHASRARSTKGIAAS